MKLATRDLCRALLLAAAALPAALNLNGAYGEQPPAKAPETDKQPASPMPPAMPPEIVKPVLPSDLKSADAVFDELDAGGRGYVSRQDTESLIGFGDAFRAADSRGSGRLTRAQFRKAWAIYQAGNR